MEEESVTHNVFDQAPTIPVVIYVRGKRKVIGTAHVEQGSDGVSVQMDLNSEDPQAAALFLQDLSSLSLSHEEDIDDHPNPHTATNHPHKAYDHEDGLTDWCDTCGLTKGFMKPRPNDWRDRMLET